MNSKININIISMKSFKILSSLIFIYFFIIGCEEVIEVELENSEPQIVIDAVIRENSTENKVTITKTTDFYNPSQFEKISGAEIWVTELNGESFMFNETFPGDYTNQELSAKVGGKYEITVNVEGKTYTASSWLPQPLILDSVSVIGEKRPFQDELDYEYHAYFQDNPGVEDYARFKLYINGTERGGIFRYDDRLTDGRYIDFWRFFFEPRDDIKQGDSVTIELITIDKASFDYFNTLRRVIASSTGGPFGSTTPSNPITNWNNGALGYFSVQSVNSKSAVIE